MKKLTIGVIDLVFISSSTQAALLAYALSNFFRSQGAVTVLGGSHARCYPDDAVQYFDYVLGFANQSTISEVLEDCSPQRLLGKYLAAGKQPLQLPGVAQRWKYIEATFKKSTFSQNDTHDRQYGLSLYLPLLH